MGLRLQVCMLLEVLRGAAAATLPTTFDALLALFSSLLGPLLTVHAAFKHIAPVVALLLKLADDIVEAMTSYMESQQQKQQLLNWVLQLLVQYRDSNLWQVRGAGCMYCATGCAGVYAHTGQGCW